MTAKQKLHQANLQRWATIFADQKASGLTIRQWCEQNNCSFHKFNYWKHALKEQVTDQMIPELVQLPVGAPASVPLANTSGFTHFSDPLVRTDRSIPTNCAIFRISIRDVTIELPVSIPEDTLRSIIRAVRYA